jgi:hypothetical protein
MKDYTGHPFPGTSWRKIPITLIAGARSEKLAINSPSKPANVRVFLALSSAEKLDEKRVLSH